MNVMLTAILLEAKKFPGKNIKTMNKNGRMKTDAAILLSAEVCISLQAPNLLHFVSF